MLKSIVCLCIVALITVNAGQVQFDDQVLQFLAQIKMTDLPESVRTSLTANQGRADASHWCCINEKPITTHTETKIEHATHVVATKTKVGYVDCGIWGWGKCSHFVTTTKVVMYTYIQTFQVPNMDSCEKHEVKCCSGYILVADNCFTFAELVANQELFQFLAGLGLLSLPSVGK